MITGVSVGAIVGIIGGVLTLILLKALDKASLKKVSTLLKLIPEFVAIPTFMFGGTWISSMLLKDFKEVKGSFFASLALFFIIMIIYPIFRWIVRLGEDLGKGTG